MKCNMYKKLSRNMSYFWKHLRWYPTFCMCSIINILMMLDFCLRSFVFHTFFGILKCSSKKNVLISVCVSQHIYISRFAIYTNAPCSLVLSHSPSSSNRHVDHIPCMPIYLRHNQSREAGCAVRQPRRRPGALPTPVMYSAGKRQSNVPECENLHHTARLKIL